MDELDYKFVLNDFEAGNYWSLELNGTEVGITYEREHAELITKAFKSVKSLEADIAILSNQKRVLEEELKELKLERASFVRAENALKSIASTLDTYNNE